MRPTPVRRPATRSCWQHLVLLLCRYDWVTLHILMSGKVFGPEHYGFADLLEKGLAPDIDFAS